MERARARPHVVRFVRAALRWSVVAACALAVHGCATPPSPSPTDLPPDPPPGPPIEGTARVTVTLSGSGTGTVASDGGDVACPPGCVVDVDEGTRLTLTAVPDVATVMGAWTGCDTVDGPTCEVEVTTDVTLDARFDLAPNDAPLEVVDGDCGSATVGETCTLFVTSSIPVDPPVDDEASLLAAAAFTVVASGADLLSIDAAGDAETCVTATSEVTVTTVRMAIVCPVPFPREARLAAVTVRRGDAVDAAVALVDATVARYGGGRQQVEVVPWEAR